MNWRTTWTLAASRQYKCAPEDGAGVAVGRGSLAEALFAAGVADDDGVAAAAAADVDGLVLDDGGGLAAGNPLAAAGDVEGLGEGVPLAVGVPEPVGSIQAPH